MLSGVMAGLASMPLSLWPNLSSHDSRYVPCGNLRYI